MPFTEYHGAYALVMGKWGLLAMVGMIFIMFIVLFLLRMADPKTRGLYWGLSVSSLAMICAAALGALVRVALDGYPKLPDFMAGATFHVVVAFASVAAAAVIAMPIAARAGWRAVFFSDLAEGWHNAIVVPMVVYVVIVSFFAFGAHPSREVWLTAILLVGAWFGCWRYDVVTGRDKQAEKRDREFLILKRSGLKTTDGVADALQQIAGGDFFIVSHPRPGDLAGRDAALRALEAAKRQLVSETL